MSGLDTTAAVKKTTGKRIGEGLPGPGRPKGGHNKNTTLLKDALLEAATKAGGRDGLIGYLVRQADANPTGFMTLLGKVIPLQVAGTDDGGNAVPFRIELIGVLPK